MPTKSIPTEQGIPEPSTSIGGPGPDPNLGAQSGGRTINVGGVGTDSGDSGCGDDPGTNSSGQTQGLSRSQIEAQRKNAVNGTQGAGGKISTGKKYDFNWEVQHLINENSMGDFASQQSTGSQVSSVSSSATSTVTKVIEWLTTVASAVRTPLAIFTVGFLAIMIFGGSAVSVGVGGRGVGSTDGTGGVSGGGGYEDNVADHCCEL